MDLPTLVRQRMPPQQLQSSIGIIIGIKSTYTIHSFVQIILVKVRVIMAIKLMSVERVHRCMQWYVII